MIAVNSNRKIFFGLLVYFLIIILGICILTYNRRQTLDNRSGAIAGAFDYYGRTINTFGLFGQKDIGQATENQISASTQEHAPGVVVDTSTSPNTVYLVDSGNSRILGFKGIGACNQDSTLICTVDADCGAGNACTVPAATVNSQPASIIIGQPDSTSGACNGDNNLGWNKPPTAATLCLLAYPWGNNTAEQWQANNIDVDPQGNLYVSDPYNNRVLEYFQPISPDKTGGKGDNIADFVWGQNDFNTNGRNRGSNNGWTNISPPDDHSLWNEGVGPKCYGNGNPAVTTDVNGNVWISDPCNHRVLRFPPQTHNADLVIGQPDFTTNQEDCTGTNLNKLCGPVQARVDAATGKLYVLDRYMGKVGFISRILVFQAPFSSGMGATNIIVPKAGNFSDWGGWDGKGTYYFQGSGITLNPDKVNYPNGILWVTEHDANRVLLIDADGNILSVINATDANHRGGTVNSGCPYYSNNGNGTGYGVFWPSSAVSFDSAANIYLTAEEYANGSHVVRFATPYKSYQLNNSTCLPLPNGGISWGAPVSRDTIEGGTGLAVWNNQLLSFHPQSAQQVYGVPHGGKLMVWNDYPTKPFGASADFILNRTGINNNNNLEVNGARISGAVDDLNRLWYASVQLNVFQLPITTDNQSLIAANLPLYWADDGAQITDAWITGAAFDPVNKAIYLVDRTRSGSQRARILRVKNYQDLNSKLLVDLVIGQTSKTGNLCNQGKPTPDAGTICDVSQIKFDKLGNLYAVDNDYECQGNRRITVYLANDLKNTVSIFPNLQAKKVFNEPDFTSTLNCAYWVHDAPGSPVSLAFNNKNQMVVGNDGYYDQAFDSQRELKQLWFYSDPLNKQTPDASINLYMGTPGEIAFDNQDNLIIQDGTWNRLNLINLCTDPGWLVPLPNTPPLDACSSHLGNTPQPLPTTNYVPSPTPTPACVNTTCYLDADHDGFRSTVSALRCVANGDCRLATDSYNSNPSAIIDCSDANSGPNLCCWTYKNVCDSTCSSTATTSKRSVKYTSKSCLKGQCTCTWSW